MRPVLPATLIAAALLTAACQGALAHPPSAARATAMRAAATKTAPIKQLTVKEAAAYLAATPNARFLDVRMAEEYAEGHAKGAALRPLPDLATWAGELPKDQPIVLICRSGSRSMKAATALQARGFGNLLNIQGGTLAWEAEQLPMER